MPRFIEIIGQYTDGEHMDLMVNLDAIRIVRPDPQKSDESIMTLVGYEPTLRVCEPYAILKKRILEMQ